MAQHSWSGVLVSDRYSVRAAISLPVSLRLVRSGTSFSAYWSTNDIDFSQVGSTQTVPINPTALAGLAVSANDNSTLCAATFNQVTTPAPIFGVYRELWPALNASAGNSLAALTNTTLNPNWPNAPNQDYTFVFSEFRNPHQHRHDLLRPAAPNLCRASGYWLLHVLDRQ